MSGLSIVTDKQSVDVVLFKDNGYSLSDIALNVNQCDSFVAMKEDHVVAQCLVANKKYFSDITHFAYTEITDFIELLSHVFEYYKKLNHKYLEIGCGNANLDQYANFQRVGFRVIGVQANYFINDDKTVNVENSIINLDMIRFRINLQEKGFTTLGSNASGIKTYN